MKVQKSSFYQTYKLYCLIYFILKSKSNKGECNVLTGNDRMMLHNAKNPFKCIRIIQKIKNEMNYTLLPDTKNVPLQLLERSDTLWKFLTLIISTKQTFFYTKNNEKQGYPYCT